MADDIDRIVAHHDEIVRRRFGRNHAAPCNRPSVITCARWTCQKANRCQAPVEMDHG